MIPALRAPAACVALLAVACGASRAAAADGADQGSAPSSQASVATSTAPLVLLVQGDALLASRPNLAEDPRDAPAGAALRLRRLRVGDDGAIGDFRLRLLVEGDADTAAGTPFTPLSGGRLPFGGSVRVTEASVAWAAYRTRASSACPSGPRSPRRSSPTTASAPRWGETWARSSIGRP